MQKVPGVTSVKVSLNEGLTILDFAPDNNVTLAKLRDVIRNNGFVTNESRIVARGAFLNSTFQVRGTREQFVPSSQYPNQEDVVVTGTVNTKDPKGLLLAVMKVEKP